MPQKRVVITGMGCLSPLGNKLDSTWEAIIAGQSGVGNITHFDPTDFKTKFAAEVKNFDFIQHLGIKLARRTDRFTQFAFIACEEAIHLSGIVINDKNADRVGVVLGTGIGAS